MRVYGAASSDSPKSAPAELAASRIGGLTSVAGSSSGTLQIADDAVQESLLQAWRSLPSLRDPDRLDAWLRRLLVRQVR